MKQSLSRKFRKMPLGKQVLYFFIVPMLVAACTLVIALKMKEEELIAYANPVLRITLMAISEAVLCFGWIIFLAIVVFAIFKYFKIDITRKSKGWGAFFYLMVVIFPGPIMTCFFLMKVNDYQNDMEMQALQERGISAKCSIVSSQSIGGKNPHYRYHFIVNDLFNNHKELDVSRRHDVLNIGDSVTIKYLPFDPTVFREVDVQ